MTADRSQARQAVRVLAALAAAIAAMVMVGWLTDSPPLTRVLARWVPMQPNTAIAVIAASVALVLTTDERRTWRRSVEAIGAGVTVIGAMTLLEWVTGENLHIDRLLDGLVREWEAPGRPAGVTAVALVLLGVALVVRVRSPRAHYVQVAAIAGFGAGYVVALGYLFGVSSLHHMLGYADMSLLTAVCLMLASLALLYTQPNRGLVALCYSGGGASQLVRHVVPLLLVGAAALGALHLLGEQHGAWDRRFGIALLTLASVAAGIAVVWRSAVVIRRGEVRRDTAEEALRRANLDLEQRVDAIVSSSPDAIMTVDERGRVVATNPVAAELFGYTLEQLVGKSVDELLPGRFRARHAGHRTQYAATPRLRPMGAGLQLTAERADGTEFPVEVSLAPVPSQSSLLVLTTVRDLTDQRRAETMLRDSAHRFTAAFDDAPVGMALVDLDDRLARVNQALATMLGYSRDELRGRSFAELVHPLDIDADTAGLRELLDGRVRGYRRELRLLAVDGAPVWTLVSTSVVRDADGDAAYLVMHIEDVRERKHYEGRLQYLAEHDPLTGLYNRRRFDEELAHHLAHRDRYGGPGALLLLDLDNFKYVNDTLGHSVGDSLIRTVGRTLRRRLRDSDVLARLGGDEFAVLLPEADLEQAQAVAASLLRAVRAEAVIVRPGARARSTASIGIALLDDPGLMSAEEALTAADLAMYGAKEEGRDRAVVFAAGGAHQARVEARFHWLERIHTALERDEFVLVAQPILDLATGQVTQHELLLRMRDGDDLVPPEQFLDIAERHGLVRAIDRWVIRAAVGLAAHQPRSVVPHFEVNLSADSLGDPDLPGYIAEQLAAQHVGGHRIVFEVTETAAIANMDTARRFVAQLSELGCGFALDDFGAGFGSFYYLKYLPFDYLKIDGEFVRNLPVSRTDQLIVASIVAAAHGLGKKAIAEYVGDQETVDLLRQFGVDYAQGYHVGRPVSLGADVPWLMPTPRRSGDDSVTAGGS